MASVTYELRDRSGALIAFHDRFDKVDGSKSFAFRQADGSSGLGGLPKSDLPLYLIQRLDAHFVVIVEGEKAAETLQAIQIPAVGTVTGASSIPSRSVLAELTGIRVYLWPDNDAVGREHMTRIGAVLALIAADVRWIDWADAPDHGDAADFVKLGGARDEVIALIDAAGPFADPPTESDESTPAMTLAETLDGVAIHLRRFVHFARPEHADAIALWTAHTHAPLERLEQSPILALTSAVKQSGKTKVLDVLEFLVANAWRITRPSESVLFRKIDRDHPTVLLDEVDAIFGDKTGSTEGIRSIFNSGNRKGTTVPRSVPAGRGFELAEFDVFCPKATAGIGGLPETILDRAIVIPMERRARSEQIEKLRARTSNQLGTPLRAGLAALVPTIEDLTVADAALPTELDDRAQDGWEPLIAIADAAGGPWPARARAAATLIFGQRSSSDDSLELRLLADMKQILSGDDPLFVPTSTILVRLVAIDASPWADIRGKPITPNFLAKVLRSFKIESVRERVAGQGNPVHGYRRADFVDPWARYLPEGSGTSGTPDTLRAPEAVSVPAVPDVPVSTETDARTTAAWGLLVTDDGEWVLGTA